MRLAFVVLLCVLAQSCVPRHSTVAAPPGREAAALFSVVSPERASGMAKFASSAEAKAVVEEAGQALSRPPRPARQLHTEGTLPGHGIHDQSVLSGKDLPAILDMAVAWRLTGEKSQIEGVDRYLSAWLSAYNTKFNPVDESGFDALFIAFDLTRADLPEQTVRNMLAFSRKTADGYLNPALAKGGTQHNFWQSQRVKLATLAAFATGDDVLIDRAEAAYRRQLSADLRAAVFGLEPLALAALAAKEHGRDWYAMKSPEGASLGNSLEWLQPYAQEQEIHEEYAKTTVAFDKVRRESGMPGFKGAWDPRKARNLYHLAARLDPAYKRTATILGRAAPWLALAFPDGCGI